MQRDEATATPLGSQAAANQRVIRKFIHTGGIQSCQLVMGFTELAEGSVWNSFPPHTHSRRTEIYFYFDLGDDPGAFHGRTAATRHLFVQNEEAVLSPSGPFIAVAARAITSSSGAWPAKTRRSTTWTQ